MKISLVRHGRVPMPSYYMNIRQFEEWMDLYKRADIVQDDDIPRETIECVQAAKFVVASDAVQPVQSAAILTNSLSFTQSSLFSEADAPSVLPLPHWVKLKPKQWKAVSRAFWLAGYCEGVESRIEAQQRAKQATDLLVGYASFYKRVALVGHGFFNSMIMRELQQRGWTGPVLHQHEHWSCTTYEYDKALIGKQLKQTVRFTAT